jgi:hypothetical protein
MKTRDIHASRTATGGLKPRRPGLLTALLVLVISIASFSAQAAVASGPTLRATDCYALSGSGYGITFAGAGFAPDSPLFFYVTDTTDTYLDGSSVSDSAGAFADMTLLVNTLPAAITVAASYTPPGETLDAIATTTVESCVASRPVTKDDCKDGNWQIYRIFNNQGDCIDYVHDLPTQA